MGHFTDLTGQKKHSLTVIGQAGKDTRLNRIMWDCLCDCGGKTKVCTGDWNAGRTKSCGCYKSRKGANHPNFRHGLTRTSEYQYRKRLQPRYGLSFEEYELLANLQGEVCAICGREPKGRLVVDHCHSSNRIRGLLCNPCNRAIGMLQDNEVVISKAASYVRRNEVSHVPTQ